MQKVNMIVYLTKICILFLNFYFIVKYYIMSDKKIEVSDIIKLASRYLLQGLIIALAAYYVPIMYKTSLRKPTLQEIALISITAACTMYMLDQFIAPVGFGAKLGAGFTIGQKLVTMV